MGLLPFFSLWRTACPHFLGASARCFTLSEHDLWCSWGFPGSNEHGCVGRPFRWKLCLRPAWRSGVKPPFPLSFHLIFFVVEPMVLWTVKERFSYEGGNGGLTSCGGSLVADCCCWCFCACPCDKEKGDDGCVRMLLFLLLAQWGTSGSISQQDTPRDRVWKGNE